MTRARTAVIAALAALCVWHVVLRRHGLDLPMIVDEGEYAYEARIWRGGGLPYRDAFDQKPPNVFLFYRAALGFSESPAAPRVLAMGFSLATMLLLFAAAPAGWSAAARLTGPAAYGVLSTSPVGDLGFAANTEVFLAFFTTLAAWCWTRAPGLRWTLFCGLACGAALMTKQTAFWTALAFAGLCLWRSGRPGLAVFSAGAALVPAAWCLYFLAAGGLGPFIEDVVTRNMSYSGVVGGAEGLAEQARWFFGRLGPMFAKGDWPFYALALFGLARTKAGARYPTETMVVLWLGAALCGVMTGLFLFPHYFLQAYPGLALAAAVGVQRLAEARPRWPAVWLVAALSLYPACVRARAYFIDPPQITARRLLYPNPLYESLAIADYIRGRTAPSDPIYIFGSETQIYVYAGRRCATRHIFSYPLTLFPRRRADIDDELARLRAAAPRIIVYSAQPFSTLISSRLGLGFRDAVRGLLRERYRCIGRVEVRPDGGRYELDPGLSSVREPDLDSPDSLFIFELR